MVTDANNESDMGCSGEFTLVASASAPEAGADGYSITVTSPSEGDTAIANQVYTVEVKKLCIFSLRKHERHEKTTGSAS